MTSGVPEWGKTLVLEDADQQGGWKENLNSQVGCLLLQVVFVEELCCHAIYHISSDGKIGVCYLCMQL
jgi:hypothetical protein